MRPHVRALSAPVIKGGPSPLYKEGLIPLSPSCLIDPMTEKILDQLFTYAHVRGYHFTTGVHPTYPNKTTKSGHSEPAIRDIFYHDSQKEEVEEEFTDLKEYHSIKEICAHSINLLRQFLDRALDLVDHSIIETED